MHYNYFYTRGIRSNAWFGFVQVHMCTHFYIHWYKEKQCHFSSVWSDFPLRLSSFLKEQEAHREHLGEMTEEVETTVKRLHKHTIRYEFRVMTHSAKP